MSTTEMTTTTFADYSAAATAQLPADFQYDYYEVHK